MINFKPMPLAEIPKEHLALLNTINGVKVPISIMSPVGTYTLSKLTLESCLPPDAQALTFHLGTTGFQVWVSSSELNHWLCQTLAVNLTQKVPEPLYLALMEKSFLNLQPVIHQATGQKVSDINFATADDHNLGDNYLNGQLVLTTETGQPTTLDLFFSCENAQLLQDIISLFPRQATSPLNTLPVTVHICGGYTDLTMADYNRLEPGDIVFFDNNLISQNSLTLSMNNRFIASGSLHEGSLTIESVKGTPMDQYSDNTQNNQPDTNQSLDALPVRLNFELGSINLPLSEIKNITEGHIIELNNKLDSPILITVNGQSMGRGELVKIGDHCGVRILSFNGENDAEEH